MIRISSSSDQTIPKIEEGWTKERGIIIYHGAIGVSLFIEFATVSTLSNGEQPLFHLLIKTPRLAADNPLSRQPIRS